MQARHLGATESELLYDYPTLSAADLVNAWTYAEAFPNEIEITIQENDGVPQSYIWLMARLYADEQFPRGVSELLRKFGHDVLTVQEADNANQRISDDQVLIFAHLNNWAVITLNHKDFA